MKKVLIIGYLWPYHNRGGARVLGLASYLPEFGWQPVVLTIPLPGKPDLGFRIIETPYRNILEFWMRLFRLKPDEGIKKQLDSRLRIGYTKSLKKSLLDFVFTRFRDIVEYPDLERGWKPFALKAGHELLESEDIEALLSSSPPVTAHLIAKELKAKRNIPWIADFPHLWSQNNNYPYSSLRRLIDVRLELRTLSKSDALTAISEPYSERLGRLHKKRPTYAILEGFDPVSVNEPPAQLTTNFTLTYTGGFHPKLREPSKLFAALQSLILKGGVEPNDVAVRFYGAREAWIDREIEQYGLSGIVKQYGAVPPKVSLEKQRESQILLLLKWQDPREPGVHSMKLYEYLAARRPILAVGGYSDVANEVLDETGAGVWAPTAEDTERILGEFYQEYKSKGEVACRGENSKIGKYSCREMARKFALLLDELI